jgi:uncharacterized protein YjdB
VGVPQQFTATGTYSDGTSYDITTQVTWTSSNTSVATVNSSGLATAISGGTATITATLGSISNSTILMVYSAGVVSVYVTPSTVLVDINTTRFLQYKATGIYTDGKSFDITTQVTWSSTNTRVAPIDPNGRAYLLNPGTTNITATWGSFIGNGVLISYAGG